MLVCLGATGDFFIRVGRSNERVISLMHGDILVFDAARESDVFHGVDAIHCCDPLKPNQLTTMGGRGVCGGGRGGNGAETATNGLGLKSLSNPSLLQRMIAVPNARITIQV